MATPVQYTSQYVPLDVSHYKGILDQRQQEYDTAIESINALQDKYSSIMTDEQDAQAKIDRIEGFRQKAKETISRYGGNAAAAFQDLRGDMRNLVQDPYWNANQVKLEKQAEYEKAKAAAGPGYFGLKEPKAVSVVDPATGKVRPRDAFDYKVYTNRQVEDIITSSADIMANTLNESILHGTGIPGLLSAETVRGLQDNPDRQKIVRELMYNKIYSSDPDFKAYNDKMKNESGQSLGPIDAIIENKLESLNLGITREYQQTPGFKPAGGGNVNSDPFNPVEIKDKTAKVTDEGKAAATDEELYPTFTPKIKELQDRISKIQIKLDKGDYNKSIGEDNTLKYSKLEDEKTLKSIKEKQQKIYDKYSQLPIFKSAVLNGMDQDDAISFVINQEKRNGTNVGSFFLPQVAGDQTPFKINGVNALISSGNLFNMETAKDITVEDITTGEIKPIEAIKGEWDWYNPMTWSTTEEANLAGYVSENKNKVDGLGIDLKRGNLKLLMPQLDKNYNINVKGTFGKDHPLTKVFDNGKDLSDVLDGKVDPMANDGKTPLPQYIKTFESKDANKNPVITSISPRKTTIDERNKILANRSEDDKDTTNPFYTLVISQSYINEDGNRVSGTQDLDPYAIQSYFNNVVSGAAQMVVGTKVTENKIENTSVE